MKVTQTITIMVPPNVVWNVLKGFGAVQKWLAKIRRYATIATSSGITRHIQSDVSGNTIESLETSNENLMTLAYRVLLGPDNLKECLVTTTVLANNKDTGVEWTVSLDSPEREEMISHW